MPERHPQSEEELMRVEEVRGIDLPAGDVGEGLRFKSSRGSFLSLIHI